MVEQADGNGTRIGVHDVQRRRAGGGEGGREGVRCLMGEDMARVALRRALSEFTFKCKSAECC